MNSFEAKKQRRIEGYKNKVEKNLKVYDENPGFKVFSEEFSGIPLGQPIHGVRDRNYRDKLEKRVRKGFEALDKADYYKDKIEAAESNTAIFSDDPKAIQKIKQKIEDLKASKEQSKQYNKKLRKFKTRAEAVEAFKDSTDKDEAFLRDHLEKCKHWYASDRIGLFYFDTTNTNQEIKRLEKRLVFLENKAKMPPIDFVIGEITVKEVDGQIRVKFPDKPNAEVRRVLKRYPHSLKYSGLSTAWVRKLTATTGQRWLNDLKNYLGNIKDNWA